MHAPLYGYNQQQSSLVVEPSSTAAAESAVPIRTNFVTPEGVYRQMTVNEFRANRIPSQVGPICNAPVRVSFLKIPTRRLSYAEEVLPSTSDAYNGQMRNANLPERRYHHHQHHEETGCYIERICFNIGREIYVFDYSSSLTNPSESAKPVDKRVYKGTFPTCHDFRQTGATLYSCSLLVGFSAGQIQLVDPSQKDVGTTSSPSSSKLFNEDRLIDKTAVTCLKWVPSEDYLFAASHISGNLYFYNEQLVSSQMSPNYQLIKQGDGYAVYGCKAKAERNPVYRWAIGKGAINKFEFGGGDCGLIAVASQDGFMRVFNWKTMDLIGYFKSYFGGLLCLAWSPDLRYIATGGEDDLLTLYSLSENRVICRGQGHKSWIAEVAFDNYAEFLRQEAANSEGGREFQGDTVLALSSESSFMLNDELPYRKANDESTSSHHHHTSHPHHHPHSTSISPLFVKQNAPIPSTSSNFAQNTCHLSPIPSDGPAAHQSASLSDAIQPTLLYRIGTVGHDCQLCLWDISEDTLNTPSTTPFDENDHLLPPHHHENAAAPSPSPLFTERSSPRNTTVIPIGIGNALTMPAENDAKAKANNQAKAGGTAAASKNSNTSRLKRFHRRGFSLGSRFTGNDRWSRQNGSASTGMAGGSSSADGTLKRTTTATAADEQQSSVAQLFGTPQCPRLGEVPVIEPLICKKVAHERLGALHFREDCIVTACQEGLICAWARPNVHARHEARHDAGEGGGGIYLNDGGAVGLATNCYDLGMDSTC